MTTHLLLQRRSGIEQPILLAPMAGSGGTPELAAAVSNAGGLGAWGGAYAKPDEIAAAIRRIRELTDRPFSVNLFAGGYEPDRIIDPHPMLEIVAAAHAKLGLLLPVLPPPPHNPFDEQFEAVLTERPPGFSFAFGVPSPAQMAALKQRDIFVAGTATTVEKPSGWRRPASMRSSRKVPKPARIARRLPRRSKTRWYRSRHSCAAFAATSRSRRSPRAASWMVRTQRRRLSLALLRCSLAPLSCRARSPERTASL